MTLELSGVDVPTLIVCNLNMLKRWPDFPSPGGQYSLHDNFCHSRKSSVAHKLQELLECRHCLSPLHNTKSSQLWLLIHRA